MDFRKLAFATLMMSFSFISYNAFSDQQQEDQIYCGELDEQCFQVKNNENQTILRGFGAKSVISRIKDEVGPIKTDRKKLENYILKNIQDAKKLATDAFHNIYHDAGTPQEQLIMPRALLYEAAKKCSERGKSREPMMMTGCLSNGIMDLSARYKKIQKDLDGDPKQIDNILRDNPTLAVVMKKCGHTQKSPQTNCITRNLSALIQQTDKAKNLLNLSFEKLMSVSHALKYCSDMGQELACKTKLTEELNKGIKPKDREAGDFCTYEGYLFQQEGPCKQPIWYAAQAIKTPEQMAEDDAKQADKLARPKGDKGQADKSDNKPGSGGKDALSLQDKKPQQSARSSGKPGGGLGTSQYGNVCPIRKSENYCGANPNEQGVRDLAAKGPVNLAAEKKCLGTLVEKYVSTSHGLGIQITIKNQIEEGNYEKALKLINENTNYDKERLPLVRGLNALEAMSKKQNPKDQTACAYISSNTQEFSGQIVNMAQIATKGSSEIPWPSVMDALDALGQVSAEATKKDLGVFDLEMKGQGLIDLALQAGENPEFAISELFKTGHENYCADRSKVDEESYRKLDKKLSDYAQRRLKELLALEQRVDDLKVKAYDNLKKVSSNIDLAEKSLKDAFVAHEELCYSDTSSLSKFKESFNTLDKTLEFFKTGESKRREFPQANNRAELCLKAKEFIKKFTEERNKKLTANPILMNLVEVNGKKTKADDSCDSIQKAASNTWKDVRSKVFSLGGTGIGGQSDNNPLNMARQYLGSDKEFCEDYTNYADAFNSDKAVDKKSKLAMVNKAVKAAFQTALKATQKSCDDGLVKMGKRLAGPSNNNFLEHYLKCDGIEEASEECQFRRAQSVGLCYLQIDEKDSSDKKETATMMAMMGLMGLGVLSAGGGVIPALAALGLDIGAVGMNHFMDDRIAHHRAVSESLLTPTMTSVTPEQFVDALNETSATGERMYKAQGALDVLFGIADLAALKMAVNAYKEGKGARELLGILNKDPEAFKRAQQLPADLSVAERREIALMDEVDKSVKEGKITEAQRAATLKDKIAADEIELEKILPGRKEKLRNEIKGSIDSRLKGTWTDDALANYKNLIDKMDHASVERLHRLELKAIDMAKKQPKFVERIKGIMTRLHERLRDEFKKNPGCFKA